MIKDHTRAMQHSERLTTPTSVNDEPEAYRMAQISGKLAVPSEREKRGVLM